MGKLKNFFGWLKVSNRPKHLYAGLLAYFGMMVEGAVLGALMSVSDTPVAGNLACILSVLALTTVFLMMCSVEFAQKRSGGLWDWLDIAAGCLVPLVFTLLIILMVVLC